jgi:hypothetical protein
MLLQHWEGFRVSGAWLGGFLLHAAVLRERPHQLVLLFLFMLPWLLDAALVVRLPTLCLMLRLLAHSSPPLLPHKRIAETAAAVFVQCGPPVHGAACVREGFVPARWQQYAIALHVVFAPMSL